MYEAYLLAVAPVVGYHELPGISIFVVVGVLILIIGVLWKIYQEIEAVQKNSTSRSSVELSAFALAEKYLALPILHLLLASPQFRAVSPVTRY